MFPLKCTLSIEHGLEYGSCCEGQGCVWNRRVRVLLGHVPLFGAICTHCTRTAGRLVPHN
jgi:hypothetical protein